MQKTTRYVTCGQDKSTIGRNLTKPTGLHISPVTILINMIIRAFEMKWAGGLSLVRFLSTCSLNNETLYLPLLFDSVRHKLNFSHTNLLKEPDANLTPWYTKAKPPFRAVLLNTVLYRFRCEARDENFWRRM
jgi:hypothetical protein